MKRLQLARLHAQLAALAARHSPLARVTEAHGRGATAARTCPDAADPPRVAAFAQALVGSARWRMTSPRAPAALVPRRDRGRAPTTRPAWRCAWRAPGWCRTAWRWHTPTRG